ncbi:hypothetical protein BaRGS_00007417 [Batillaria attramentaria]|uniref:Uncharacterized protein n=1 Tax=Batillaria attramentaria TaxID=370345 RepID=A0ABD0LPM4_9CAEN
MSPAVPTSDARTTLITENQPQLGVAVESDPCIEPSVARGVSLGGGQRRAQTAGMAECQLKLIDTRQSHEQTTRGRRFGASQDALPCCTRFLSSALSIVVSFATLLVSDVKVCLRFDTKNVLIL